MVSLVVALERDAASSAERAYHILVVDDERDIRDAIKGLLERALKNVTVFTADSGFTGLEVLNHEPIDLIVTDYKMPGMDGVEFLEKASGLSPKAPRILITAFERELADALSGHEKVSMVFTKPLEPRPLVQTCKRMLAESAA